jgi:hypothetical protein
MLDSDFTASPLRYTGVVRGRALKSRDDPDPSVLNQNTLQLLSHWKHAPFDIDRSHLNALSFCMLALSTKHYLARTK